MLLTYMVVSFDGSSATQHGNNLSIREFRFARPCPRSLDCDWHSRTGRKSRPSIGYRKFGIPYKSYLATCVVELKMPDPQAFQTIVPVNYIRVTTNKHTQMDRLITTLGVLTLA